MIAFGAGVRRACFKNNNNNNNNINNNNRRNKACQARSMELDALVPQLPKVSVILCFFNEEWFALLRSVWGVVLTSPPELVDEILLVDDGSTMHHLHDLLDE